MPAAWKTARLDPISFGCLRLRHPRDADGERNPQQQPAVAVAGVVSFDVGRTAGIGVIG
jgi:hypothetical protein